MRLHLGLVHYPVYNKNSQIIASAVTTLDIHDIARLSKTYGVKKFFVITPLRDQAALVEKIIRHWTTGYGANYNRHRKEAIELVTVVPDISAAIDKVTELEGEAPVLIATDASKYQNRPILFKDGKNTLADQKPVFLIFGTAWGLDKKVLAYANHVLEPVSGMTGYRHLSVRSAAAIIVDRLVGDT